MHMISQYGDLSCLLLFQEVAAGVSSRRGGISVRVSNGPQGIGSQGVRAGVNYSSWKPLHQQRKTLYCSRKDPGEVSIFWIGSL